MIGVFVGLQLANTRLVRHFSMIAPFGYDINANHATLLLPCYALYQVSACVFDYV